MDILEVLDDAKNRVCDYWHENGKESTLMGVLTSISALDTSVTPPEGERELALQIHHECLIDSSQSEKHQ